MKYIHKILSLVVVLALTITGLFLWVQRLPAQFGSSIMGTVRHKIDLLQTTEGPRLILAGGSSSPYATNCEYIAQQTGLNCINVGVTAYFGIEFYLSMLENYMQPGDTIVIAPEHSMLSNNISYSTMWMGMENYTEVWNLVPADYWPGLVLSWGEYAGKKVRMHGEDTDWESAFYHADFGPLGDVVTYRESILEDGWLPGDPVALKKNTLNWWVVYVLDAFYRQAQQRGVTVYFAFAPLNRKAVTTSANEWLALENAIRGQIDMPVLGSLEEAIMDSRYFYDSNNHLTTEGAALYSARLVQLLAGAQTA